ncbi:lysozyme inhibitor LprI family protein [Sphingobium sp. C100]|uniref:lysozyme inhibitor LprI family protein n=1 Tax=Sphingobium sp. C100 TaxID=1207055 RepID=UPI0009FD3EFE|nr:MAG: DUF1311 domain-containing protein [Sphingobium sp.]
MILLIFLAAVTQAPSTPSIYPADKDCQDYGYGSPVAMAECFTAQSDVWDRRLNEEYHAALRRAEIEPRQLRASQRLWLQYRDVNCAAYSTVKGSIAKILAGRCSRDLTRDRTLDLHEMVRTG